MANSQIDVNVFSLNCNGLSDKVKRTSVFNHLKRKRKGIFMLQETHTTLNSEFTWKNQWGCKKVFFSHGTSNSRGTAILISSDYDVSVLKEFKDEYGRFIILDIIINEARFTLGNLYAPTRNFEKDQIDVFKTFTEKISECNDENVILGGDFNLYLNPRLDKLDNMPETGDNASYRVEIESYMEVNNLVDVWRVINPDKRFFTWSRGTKRSRLDYFLVSEHLLNYTDNTDILPGFMSDHSLLQFTCSSGNSDSKGKGFWKFNSSLLHDDVYVDQVKNIIKDTKAMYMEYTDKGFVWELVKSKIRSFTVPYTSKKKKIANKHEELLNNRFTQLYAIINQGGQVEKNICDEYNNIKSELEVIERHRARGIILRSKVQWTEDGETNSSYFLRLEKNNYCNKLISKLQVDNKLITNAKEILNEEKHFYEKLYSNPKDHCNEKTRECTEYFAKSSNIPRLTDDQKNKCDEPISEKELLLSIKAMKNNKSPGTDGLTAEFYKFFWNDLKELLLNSLQYALDNNQLSIEQKRGIITLIPKKDKNRLYLKNWRPITLLNLDYKILAKLLANRMIDFLPDIINEDQTGYVKERFIGCNIRLIEDIIYYTNRNNIPGILLSIDFEKAFDSIKWSFIDKTLELFNFGIRYRSYIKTLYNDISSCIINNGNISQWFYPERGVRQGCPISAYLFILSVEVLASSIRENKNIKGISVNNVEIKISQLADDTTCFLKDVESVKELLKVFEKFKICAGLQVNVEKTKAKTLGPIKVNPNLCNLDWTKDPIHSLGVYITGNEDDHYILNFKKRLKTLQSLLSSWKSRGLSLKGKVTVINSLALSPLIYLASVIHVPTIVYKEVKDIINLFIWDSKIPRIAHNVMIQKIQDGGLKLVDFREKVKALKVAWIKRLVDNTSSRWKAAPSVFYKCNDLSFYFSCNQEPLNILKPEFYSDIHNFWSELKNVSDITTETVINEIIWNNRNIRIDNKPFLWKNWKDRGILKINDILDESGNFMGHIEINQKYNVNCNFLTALQLRHSVPFEWRRLLLQHQSEVVNKIHSGPHITTKNGTFHINKCDTKKLYWNFVMKNARKPTCIRRWSEIYTDIEENNWQDIFDLAFRVSRETKIQSLQYKIIHRIVNCNKKLYDWKIKDSAKCSYCLNEDDVCHFFLHCPRTNGFWKHFINWWNRCNDLEIKGGDGNLFMLGYPSYEPVYVVLNYCILQAKHYIYTRKLYHDNNIDLYDFLVILKNKLHIELFMCKIKYIPACYELFMTLYDNL